MAYKDKNDQRLKDARMRWYHKNKNRQLDNQKSKKIHIRSFLKRWKSTQSCRDCGIEFKGQEYLCDLHHLDHKSENVGHFLNYSVKRLKEEIRKCIPLCANCHRRRHKDDIYG